MKSVNVNVLHMVSTLVAAGEITVAQLNEAIKEKRGLNMPCGSLKDEHGQFYAFFVATDKDDRTKARRSEDGLRIKFNFRLNKPKAQEAQTPGQVLPQGQIGAPTLDANSLAAVAALLAQLQAGALATVQAKATPEDDFGELNEVIQ